MRAESVPLRKVTFPEGVAPHVPCNLEKYVIRLQIVIQKEFRSLKQICSQNTRLYSFPTTAKRDGVDGGWYS
jgi:hypothetical protein